MAVLIACTHQTGDVSQVSRAYGCTAPNETTNILLSKYRWLATTTSAPNVQDREAMGLPFLSSSEVRVVVDAPTCSRAVVAFNRAFEPDPSTTTEVHVLRFGPTHYVVVDEHRTAGEWLYRATFDSSFTRILSRGRE